MKGLGPERPASADGFRADQEVYRSRRTLIELGAQGGVQVAQKRSADPRSARAGRRALHEFRMISKVRSDYVVRALGVDEARGALLLEYVDGKSFAELARPLPLEEFFDVARDICRALSAVHEAGLIHKDVNPSNLVRARSGHTKLIDFELSTRSALSSQEFRAASQLEGTLAYMAPEQTGRTNQMLDYRADLYALGATLYYLLSGRPPFEATDPLELLHRHVAALPAPVAGVPEKLDAIIQKLLAKNADERYQSAHGVERDLERLRRGELGELATDDVSHCLSLPGRLIGRERESQALRAAFARVEKEGHCQVVLVGGYSGVGKTTLVREVHRPLVALRGYYLYGKFDQFRRHAPYAALASALEAHVHVLLGESEAVLRATRERLRSALGDERGALAELFPFLAPLLGAVAAPQGLSPRDVQLQGQRLVRRLFDVLALRDHPLVLFLDDLQWADPATLTFLEQSAGVGHHMLVVGAYRDNEVGASHPLRELVSRLPAQRTTLLELAPLTLADVVTYAAETLREPRARVEELAASLYRRTDGNPFFLGQTLLELFHAAVFRMRGGRWTWDQARLGELAPADNVVDITARRIARADLGVRQLLGAAACLGNEFDLSEAVELAGLAPGQGEPLAEHALLEGFIAARGDDRFTFLHDRVRRAAYEHGTASERRALHRRVTLAWLGTVRGKTRLFEHASHATLGIDWEAPDGDRELLRHAVALNLAAAQRAYGAGGFEIAAHHAETCRALAGAVGPEGADAKRAATSIYGDAEYSCGHFAAAHAAYDELLASEADPIRRSATYRQKAVAKTVEGQLEEAFGYFGILAKELGFDFNTQPTDDEAAGMVAWARESLVEFGLAELDDLPPCSEGSSSVLIDACLYFGTVAYLCRPASFKALTSYTIIHCFDWGVSPSAPPMITAWAYSAASARDYPLALAVARAGLRLADKHSPQAIVARARTLFALFASHYERSVPSCLEELRAAADTCASHGDLEYAGHARVEHDSLLALIDGPEASTRERCARTLSWATDFHVVPCLEAGRLTHEFLERLHGAAPSPGPLAAPAAPFAAAARAAGLATALNVLLGNYAAAADSYRRFVGLRQELEGTLSFTLFTFMGGVALARTGEQADPLLCEARELVRLHADIHPALSGPLARMLGLLEPAGDLAQRQAELEQVLEATRAARMPLVTALCGALAAEQLRAHGQRRLAHSFAEEAFRACAELGAHAVARSLQLRLMDVGLRPTNTASTLLEGGRTAISDPHALDLWSVVKASQTLASEVRFEPLISRLLELARENAGAQRAVLLARRGDDLAMVAELADASEVAHDEPLRGTSSVPEALLRETWRSGEPAVLDDAAADLRWGALDYFRRTQVRSALCMPIRQGSEMFGILYLENRVVAGAFHAGRLEVLRILASQAAVSLENARLMREEAEQQRLAHALAAAAEIQRSLVPAAPRVPGFEVAAHMTPADRIGGDYYDVIRGPDATWFVIGDVCGHGLPAGLIMIMCQTALHAVLQGQPSIDPAAAIVQVNRLLKANLERFRASTYVALTLFRQRADGVIEYSGLHEPLLVFRRATGRVEAHATRGTWLGIVDDLAPLVGVDQLELAPGDVLLLYTDGVTEARAPADGSMLGRDGLTRLLEDSGRLPLETIKERILATVREYRSSDDVTLMLLRRS